MKNYRNFISHFKFQITNALHCACIFLCRLTMTSDFLIIYVFSIFLGFLFHKYNILSHLCVILILFLLMVIFFCFQNQLYFLHVILKNHKIFSYNLFRNIKYACFLHDQIPQIIDIESPQGICSPIFVVEKFSRLFSHSSIFLIKYSRRN